MPTYDYRCGRCGHQFERFQGMSDRVMRTCPRCRRRSLKRVIGTGAGLLFKGSGFYITDYRSDSYKSAESADAPAGGAAKKDAGKTATPTTDTSSPSKVAPKKAEPPPS